jgi:hypothetical protein
MRHDSRRPKVGKIRWLSGLGRRMQLRLGGITVSASSWLPHFHRDSSHLLVGWQKDGWKGPHLQWEFGAYVNLDLALSERHDYRFTYNYPAWRRPKPFRSGRDPLPRFQFSR